MGINSQYNEKLVIENGKLAYDTDKISNQEKEWLEEKGIAAKSNYYLIMMETTKKDFAGQTNIGTLAEFGNLVNTSSFNYDTAYVIENLNLETDGINNLTPIGTETNYFNKIFDGGGYEISNISVETEGLAGLFGYVGNATIKNVITNGTISSKDNKAGGIVAMVIGNSITSVINCTNKCEVNSISEGDNTQAGGIIGNTEANLQLTNCSNKGNITAYNHAGGIIARVNGHTNILNCHNSATIITNGIDKHAGGIVGVLRPDKEANIEASSNSGKIARICK